MQIEGIGLTKMVHTSGMNIETRWKGASMEQHTSESFENLEPADRMKYEIAEELGLLEKSEKADGRHCHPGRPDRSAEW